MEYESEVTGRYEGVYTEDEVALNKRLYEECMKDEVNFGIVEELLVKGADPLGAMAVRGWNLLLHVYGEVAFDSADEGSKNLPRITELFLKHGMDVGSPRIPYDDNDSLHPLRFFPLNENGIAALKLILDNGAMASDVRQIWRAEADDWINVCEDDPNSEECGEDFNCWAKMLMLIASYDHVLSCDEGLRSFIEYDRNDYDVHRFREWEDFYFEFDTSKCVGKPKLYGSVIRIYEKATKKQVWSFSVSGKNE